LPPTDEDFEVLRRAWAAVSRDDQDGMLRDFHPEIVAVPLGAAMETTAYRGPEQVLRWWREEILANWETFQVLPEQFERVGDRMLVTGRWNARGKSGVDLDVPASWIVEVRDGKIAYWQTYTDPAEARRDAGLED
jgi:ketosteroid isomerase-like protein